MPSATQSKKHICGTCHASFKSKAAQRNHRRDKHTQPPAQPIQPPSPPSSNISSPAQTKKHVCDVCQRAFGSKTAQKDHRKAKHFPSNQQQSNHSVMQQSMVQNKKHICNVCEKGFDSKVAQQDHQRAKHLSSGQQDLIRPIVQQSTVQPKKHTCGTLQEVFDTESAREKHRVERHSHPVATQEIAEVSALPILAPVYVIVHRGIVYSTFSAVEQDVIRSYIANWCHSEKRLEKEGYQLPSTLMINKGSKKTTATTTMTLPERSPFFPKRTAVVLDCEMAGAVDGQNELIQVTMLDFLSGDILKSCLVNPSTPIKDWREDITGINDRIMAEAVRNNAALHGWEAARAELWRFADRDTIIIGHSVHHDLKALHTSHTRIVDTAIVTAEAALGRNSKLGKRWALVTLCQELLGIQIRISSQPGNPTIHDSLEDTLATRELCLLCVQRPDQLKRWGRAAKAAFFKGKGKKSKSSKSGISRRSDYFAVEESDSDYDDCDELLRWEDVISWEMWPKSPPSD